MHKNKLSKDRLQPLILSCTFNTDVLTPLISILLKFAFLEDDNPSIISVKKSRWIHQLNSFQSIGINVKYPFKLPYSGPNWYFLNFSQNGFNFQFLTSNELCQDKCLHESKWYANQWQTPEIDTYINLDKQAFLEFLLDNSTSYIPPKERRKIKYNNIK